MRAPILTTAVLLGLGWLVQSQARADDWWPDHRHFHPPQMNLPYGSTPYNNVQYRIPHLEQHYYTPPSFAPDSPPAFGYTPYNSYNYRLTRPFTYYDYRSVNTY